VFLELLCHESEAADRFLSHEVLKLPLSFEAERTSAPKSVNTREPNLKFCQKRSKRNYEYFNIEANFTVALKDEHKMFWSKCSIP